MTDSTLDSSPFWTFTLAAYKQEGFPAACVFLQDRLCVDVDFLLFGLFAGANGRLLSAEELEAVEAASSPWRRNVLQPLRAVRTWLKSQSCLSADEVRELRSGVLSREIESNGYQQLLMERAVAIPQGEPDECSAEANAEAMASNLIACLRAAGVLSIIDADARALAVLIRSMLPDLTADAALAYVSAAAPNLEAHRDLACQNTTSP